jgi:hypothetical protein
MIILKSPKLTLKAISFSVLFLFSCIFAQSSWEWRNPIPQGNYLMSVSYVNNQYIASSQFGVLLFSTDGINWTLRSSGIDRGIRQIIYENGLYIGISDSSTIYPALLMAMVNL